LNIIGAHSRPTFELGRSSFEYNPGGLSGIYNSNPCRLANA
jgi:hypothetical protein